MPGRRSKLPGFARRPITGGPAAAGAVTWPAADVNRGRRGRPRKRRRIFFLSHRPGTPLPFFCLRSAGSLWAAAAAAGRHVSSTDGPQAVPAFFLCPGMTWLCQAVLCQRSLQARSDPSCLARGCLSRSLMGFHVPDKVAGC